MPGAFDWSHGPVLAGTDVTVSVVDAPCRPIRVKLLIRGEVVDSGEITEAPGTLELSVPAGTEGSGYEIIVSCDGQSDSKSGTVL